MPFVAAPGIVSIDAVWTIDQQPVENTFHYKPTVAITRDLLSSMCNTYITWANASIGNWSTQTGLLKVLARDLTTQAGLTFEAQPVPPVTGHNASQPLPNNVTIAIKRQSGLAGRALRGRVFHFGMAEDFLQEFNTLSVSFGNTLVAAYEGLMTAMVADNEAPEVILHRKLGTSTPVANYVLTDFTLDSQRRRLPGHNRHR